MEGSIMTFKQAKQKLATIADGEYRSIKYEETIYDDNSVGTVCTIYITGYGLNHGKTWALAFASLELKMAGLEEADKKTDENEAPKGDN